MHHHSKSINLIESVKDTDRGSQLVKSDVVYLVSINLVRQISTELFKTF